MRGCLLIILLIMPSSARADLAASGYIKDLYSYTRSPLSRSPYYLNLTRARLSLDDSIGLGQNAPRLAAHVDYDHEVRAGSYFQSLDYKLLPLPESPSYYDLDQTIIRGNSYQWCHRVYRGYAGLETDDGFLRFGRQRIAWGTGKLWNPTDVLNPYDPTTLERDERRGVDSLYARHSAGELGQAEGAYALGDRWAATSLLGRMRSHFGAADVSVMGGKVAASTSSWMAGGDFSSNLWDGNFHGEVSYTDLRTRTPYWRAVAGYEYTFSSSPPARWMKDLWVLAEYFRNGAGVVEPLRYNYGELLAGRTIALARDYFGFGLGQDLHPLVKAEIYGILNLNDGSKFIGPALTWNAMKNFYLTAGFQRFGGGLITEFGRLPNIAYLQAQFFF